MSELVGIDFSILSPAVSIWTGTEHRYFSFTTERTDYKLQTHRSLGPMVETICWERTTPIDDTYVSKEWAKNHDAKILSDLITNKISSVCKKPTIAFEGFSYGSKGSSFIDLIVFNSFTKRALIDRFDISLYVFSPAEVKRDFSGKGNSKKPEMYRSLIEKNHELASKFHSIAGDYSPTMKLQKPIDDLIDSIAILEKLKSVLNPS